MSELQKNWAREAPYQPGIFLDVQTLSNFRIGDYRTKILF